MWKTIYIDIALEKKKVIKQMKDLEKELEKSTKRTKKNNDITPKIDDSKIKEVLNSIKGDFQKFARDTWVEIDKITFENLQSEITETKVRLKLLRQAQKEVEKADWPESSDYKKLDKEIENVSDSLTEAKRRMKNLKNIWDTTTSRLQKKFDKLWSWISKTFWKIWTAISSAFTMLWWRRIIDWINQLSDLWWKSKEVSDAYYRMTERFNINWEESLNQLKKTSKWAISEYNLMLASNKAMSLWVVKNQDDLNTLLEISRVKAKNMGISTTQAFDDIVTWLWRWSAMILDNLWITVKVSSAQEEYAKSIWKTVKELTDEEKKQALINKVVSQGKDELKALWEIETTVAEKKAKLSASIENLKNKFWELLLPVVEKLTWVLTPLIEKLINFIEENPKLSTTLWILTIALWWLAVVLWWVAFAITTLLPWLATIAWVLWTVVAPIWIVIAWLTALWVAYSQNIGWFKDKVLELWVNILPVFTQLKDKIWELILYLNEKFWNEAKLIFSGLLDVIITFTSFSIDLISWFINFFSKSGEDLSLEWKLLRGVFLWIWDVVKVSFQNILSIIKWVLWIVWNTIKIFSSLIKWDFKWAFEWVQWITKTFSSLFKNIISDTINWALSIIGNFVPNFKQYWQNLINSLIDWVRSKIKEVWDVARWVAQKIKDYIWVESPTKEWPLSLDQSIWWKNLIKAVANWIKSEIPNIKNEVENIAKELSELEKLQDKYKTQSSVEKQTSKLNDKLAKLEFWSEWFNETKRQIIQLQNLSKRYNWEKTEQEQRLEEIKENSFKESMKYIEETSSKQEWLDENLLENYKLKAKAVKQLFDLQEDVNLSEEQQVEINKKIADYKNDLKDISIKIFEEEEKSIQKLKESIESLQKEAKKITEDKDTSIAERKLAIEKERYELLEKASKLEDPQLTSRNKDIKDIDVQLEGSLWEEQRLQLEEKRKKLLDWLNDRILRQNTLTAEAYELKKKLLALDEEEKVVDKNINTESLDEVRSEQWKTVTDEILSKYEEEKEGIEEKLKVQLEALETEGKEFKKIIDLKVQWEQLFTWTIVTEINKRIWENARLLDDARRVAAEMAALWFNWNWFTATFEKTDSETWEVTSVTKTINIVNNNTIDNSVDIRKQARLQAKQIARAESSWNIY